MLIKPQQKYLLLTQFTCRDIVAVQASLPTDGERQEVVIASAYFPGDLEEVPPPEVKNLINFCKRTNRGLILGCDANAHHLAWGSTDTNDRGEQLLDFICSTNLEIEVVNPLSLLERDRSVILDIILATPSLSARITKWRISKEASLSDHRHIGF